MIVRNRAFAWVAAGIGLVSASQVATGGTIRHDVLDSTYTATGNLPQYAPVGLLSVNGDTRNGVLVRPNLTDATSRFLVTAAHNVAFNVGNPTGLQFTVGGNTYT